MIVLIRETHSEFNLIRSCTKPTEVPLHMEQLTPIDEEPAEDNDEDQPITMIPKIMHTAPSPTSEVPPTSNVTSASQNTTPAPSAVTTTTSPAPATVDDNQKESNNKQSITNGSVDKEISQIESVL